MVLASVLHANLQAQSSADSRVALERHAELLVPLAAAALRGEASAIQDQLEELGRATQLRITLLDAKGSVRADSHLDRDAVDDLASPEVAEAFTTGNGVDTRFDEVLGRDEVFVARRVQAGGQTLGALRIVRSPDSANGGLARTVGRILFAAVLAVALALLMGMFVARRLTAPIDEVTSTALALGQGHYHTRVHNLPQDEFGRLGEALNRLGSELTRRVEALASEEGRLRAMLTAMAEGVVAVDGQDRVVFANRAAIELLGIDGGGELAGRRLVELMRTVDLHELIQEARAGGGGARREITLVRSGSELLLLAEAQALGEESAHGVVLVVQDITELRRLETMRRDFVANVSHELKTPLTSVRGYVETLLEGALHDDEHNERFLRKIEQNVRRLNHLVSDLLSLGRVESQQLGLQLEPVDLCALIQGVVSRHEGAAHDKDIVLTVQADTKPGSLLRVMGDLESLVQVADNLLSNAIKYSSRGDSVTIRVERSGERGIFAVTDTGIGIPAQDLDRIFERFYRVDKARSRELGGTGLGLAIVKHLVQAMGGEVDVESTQGEGSTFYVRLPLVP